MLHCTAALHCTFQGPYVCLIYSSILIYVKFYLQMKKIQLKGKSYVPILKNESSHTTLK